MLGTSLVRGYSRLSQRHDIRLNIPLRVLWCGVTSRRGWASPEYSGFEGAKSSPVPEEPFSTHNVDQQPCLLPWIEVFKSKADGATDCLFMERVLMRLMKGELSSYDHLVTALCSSPREATRQLLEKSIFPRLLDPSTSSVRPTIPSLIAMTVGNLKISVPASCCFALALHELTTQALFVGAPAALCGAAAVTYIEARRINEAVRAKLQHAVDFTDSREFMHYAEPLYQKLCKFAGEDFRNASLIQKIEASSKFSPQIDSWQKSLAAAATGASQE